MKSTLRLAAGLAVLCASISAFAQAGTGFTISDGDVFFVQGNSPTLATGTGATGANFRVNGSAGVDHMFQNWWWSRVDGVEIRENAFANASGTIVSGNSATTNFTFTNFTAALNWRVQDTGVDMGGLAMSLSVTNTSSTAMTLNLFNYLDLDVNALTANNADLEAPGRMAVSAAPWTVHYEGVGSNAYQVTTFATLRAALADADIDNLNNTGLPLVAADFTGAYQWALQLGAGQSAVIEGGVYVPEPSTIAIFAVGGLALLARRRRK